MAFISIDLVYNAMPDVCPTLEYWSMQNMSYQILVYLNSKLSFEIVLDFLLHIMKLTPFERSHFRRKNVKIYFSSNMCCDINSTSADILALQDHI